MKPAKGQIETVAGSTLRNLFSLPFSLVCAKLLLLAPLAQWIEHRPPEPVAQVRVLQGVYWS
jgi:hypothetical protein